MFDKFETILAKCNKGETVPLHVGRRTYQFRCTAGTPALATSIDKAEEVLGHRLPDDLKAFLSRWNGAELYSQEIGGGVTIYSIDELIKENRYNYRFESEPHDVLIAGKLDYGSDMFLDLRRPNESEWPVYWTDENESIEDALSRGPFTPSFGDFIERLISMT